MRRKAETSRDAGLSRIEASGKQNYRPLWGSGVASNEKKTIFEDAHLSCRELRRRCHDEWHGWAFSLMEARPYLTIEEVARHFGVNPTTVYRLAQRGTLPGFKIGNQWRFSLEMLESWVTDRVSIERFRPEETSPRPSAPKISRKGNP